MSKTNTADQWLIERVEYLKSQGVDKFMCCTWNGNRWMRPVWRATAQGISKYANDMFRKYGEGVSVTVEYLDDKAMEFKSLTYYQA